MSQVNLREPADLRELAADELDIVSGGFPWQEVRAGEGPVS